MQFNINFRDLPILLKKDRRYQSALVITILLICWSLLFSDTPNKTRQIVRFENAAIGAGNPGDDYAQDILSVFKSGFEDFNKRVEKLERNAELQNESIRNSEARTVTILRKLLERINENDLRQASQASGQSDPVDISSNNGVVHSLNYEQPEIWGELDPTVVVPSPAMPDRVAIIGTGDRVRVRLLTGVMANTGGNPYPVIFQLTGDIIGPDVSSLPVGEALIMAAAQGSLLDQRATFRLTEMNLRMPNGRRKIIPVDGWIVGEDGMRGMSGVLLDPIGKSLAASATSSAIDAFGNAVADVNSNTTTDRYGSRTTNFNGELLPFVFGKSVSSAANTWTDFIKARSELLEPAIEILPDRESTAVFAKSVTIPDLYETLEDSDENMHFISMD